MRDSAARPPEPPEETLRRVLASLHPKLYSSSETFRRDIEAFVALLPAMVDGLAAKAEIAEEARQRDAERQSPAGVIHFPHR